MEQNENKAALYLIPVGLSDAEPSRVVPEFNVAVSGRIKWFVVENVRTARRWLRKCDRNFDIDAVHFEELNKHTSPEVLSSYLDPLRRGESVAVMSEAGCPAVADPGAALVAIAQKEGFKVVPLVGPSSILMSLMASGFNGQSFCFHGYLPIGDREREQTLRRLERESSEWDRTQIFIETPYRNNKMIVAVIAALHPDTMLCVASGLTSDEESVVSLPVAAWKKRKFDYTKIPSIFLIYSPSTRSVGKNNRRKH